MTEEETPWEFSRPDSFAVKELKDTFAQGDKSDIIMLILLTLDIDDEKLRDVRMAHIKTALDELGLAFPTDAEIMAFNNQSNN